MGQMTFFFLFFFFYNSIFVLYYNVKTTISFLYKQELNHRFLIRQQEILPIELTRNHNNRTYDFFFFWRDNYNMLLIPQLEPFPS